MVDKIKPYAKAVIAFVAPGVVAAVAAVTPDSPGGSAVTVPEWVGIAAACILTAAGVYVVPNEAASDPDEVPK